MRDKTQVSSHRAVCERLQGTLTMRDKAQGPIYLISKVQRKKTQYYPLIYSLQMDVLINRQDSFSVEI
jgi:hypothetical protein